MMNPALQKARDYEARAMRLIGEAERPAFHVTGGAGWINDPNGFSLYKGEVHLFYQYNPYETKWGPMHWGHVKTQDFIRWERLPVALAPETEYDRDGCFSGSAVELPDGRQLLLYTGVRCAADENGQKREFQTQCVATGDGYNYEKYPGNPVLTGSDVPPGNSAHDFRDPKIWKEPDGTYRCVAGNRGSDGSGEILLFASDDAFHWRFVCTLAKCQNEYGRMWECPDFFPLDGRHVLLVSPQEMRPLGLEFHAGHGVVCITGKWDEAQKRFTRERAQAVDYGIDFYAPQTLQMPDGRRVMIAWMQNWETSDCVPRHARFFGEMTVPRELSLKGGRLAQNPVRELEKYRRGRVAYRDVPVVGETNLHGVRGRVLDMTVDVRPAGAAYGWFALRVAKDGEHETVVRYDPQSSIVHVDRSRCGGRFDVVHTRDFFVRPRGGAIRLRIVMDRHSLELFVNDGEQAATFILRAPQSADAISFEAGDGAVLVDVEKYDIDLAQGE